MKNIEIEKIIKTAEIKTLPPEGLKEKILQGIFGKTEPVLSPVEEFIFEKPLRAAFAVGLLVSGAFWAAMGKGFTEFFCSILG